MILFDLLLSAVNIAAMLLLICMILRNSVLPQSDRQYFLLSYSAIATVIAAELATVLLENSAPAYRVLYIAANLVGFLLSPAIPVLIGRAIGPSQRRTTILCWIPTAVNLIFTILSLWFGLIFSVDAANSYHRGGYYWVFVLSFLSSLLFLFWETLTEARFRQSQNRLVWILMFLFVTLGTIVQVLSPEIHVSWLCISFAAALYYAHYCEMSQQLDALTSLLNRCAYETQLDHADGTQNITILYFDVDNFKQINDDYGHAIGDDCLVTIASCILGAFSKVGFCYRIGGDEFCVISHVTEKVDIRAAQQDFLRRIHSARRQDPRVPMVSVGCGIYLRGIGSVRDAVQSADRQMYHFKQRRKSMDPDQCSMEDEPSLVEP
ncbi:MAG: GGDEF domain-containing protein [Oscillospiraceae bacterium]|nr:GGDEF domain-containing protein [Oscillospiraceae bacterium]